MRKLLKRALFVFLGAALLTLLDYGIHANLPLSTLTKLNLSENIATAGVPNIPSFPEFLQSVETSKPVQFVNKPGRKVGNEKAFAQMKAHILDYYQDTEVKHSFVDDNESIFDCIPTEQQLSLRGSFSKVPKAPELPSQESSAGTENNQQAQQIASPLSPNRKDKYGNQTFCAEGTIPIRRLTLEELTRFETIQHFFHKHSKERLNLPLQNAVPATTEIQNHRWAEARQNVNNLGGRSYLNVWAPSIGANQIFSLSQHWYTAGSGSNQQTAEIGWQVYPQIYKTTLPVLFIYWTADGYNKTGCYNLDCPSFVQTNNAWALGGAINTLSTRNGTQSELQVSYYLYQGRWWVYVNGTAIGYYPTSIYNNGAMASYATTIDYGGEVDGNASWPPMGSGALANAGYQQAAYQRDITYFSTTGSAYSANNLIGAAASPQCYTINVNSLNSPFNKTIFFGGPGGTNC